MFFDARPRCSVVCACACECVHVILRGMYINENANWKKRAASCVTATLNIVGFLNVYLLPLFFFESHSPWGSRGLCIYTYIRWLTVKGVLLCLCEQSKLLYFPHGVSHFLWPPFFHPIVPPALPNYLFNLKKRQGFFFLPLRLSTDVSAALCSIVRLISYTLPMRQVGANHSALHVMQLLWTNETVITKIMRNMQYHPVTLGLVICEHESLCAATPLEFFMDSDTFFFCIFSVVTVPLEMHTQSTSSLFILWIPDCREQYPPPNNVCLCDVFAMYNKEQCRLRSISCAT